MARVDGIDERLRRMEEQLVAEPVLAELLDCLPEKTEGGGS